MAPYQNVKKKDKTTTTKVVTEQGKQRTEKRCI